MQKFDKYKENLRHSKSNNEIKIFSYDTLVATCEDGENLIQSKYYSITTQKHINYAAKCLDLVLKKTF